MEAEKKAFFEHFAELEDPRTRRSPHSLMELLLTAICGVLCGADSWTGVALWGEAKLSWLRQFLPFACLVRAWSRAGPGTMAPTTTSPASW